MTHLALEGNFAEAAKIQIEQVTPLADALFMETNPIPVKEAMNLMGMDVGELRMPLFPMSDANRDKLCDALKKAELL